MPHQREAVRYARGQDHPALFMEMRLGKTLPTIRRLLMYAPLRPSTSARFLIIAPNSALGSWERELASEGETDVVFLQGTRAERLELLGSGARWNMINKEGWLALPEIGNRRYCDTCAGNGTRRRPHGTTVVNLKTDKCDVRIDRTSKWGNQFMIKRGQPRLASIRLYRKWIQEEEQQHLLDALMELVNQRLGCWCKPLACHGDVLLSLLQARMPMETCPDCAGAGHTQMPSKYFWDAVVLDESTFIKNPKAQVTRFFLKNFRDVPHRWALTGLPAPEGPLDLWCQLAWLHGRAFDCGNYWSFRSRRFEPDCMGFDWDPKPGTSEMIEAELARRAFCLRRQDAGMTTPKVYERREVVLPPKMREAYEKAEKLFVLEYEGREVGRTVWATQRWHWLRQLCSGYVDRRLCWSGKIDELASLLTGELAREQVVVWFAYNGELRACLEALRKKRVRAEVMLGEVKPERRRELERHFRRGWFRALLIQEAVAETGLDLSTADTAIYFSNHPGLEKRAQSEDRLIHPLKKSPCLYIDLVVKDSVEEVVSEKLAVKKWRSQRSFDRAVLAGMRERRTG
jgi:hypothetical protein